MGEHHEGQHCFDRAIHSFLKVRIGNACHVLADLLALEAPNMSPEHLRMAREELNKIMGGVEETSSMIQLGSFPRGRRICEGELN